MIKFALYFLLVFIRQNSVGPPSNVEETKSNNLKDDIIKKLSITGQPIYPRVKKLEQFYLGLLIATSIAQQEISNFNLQFDIHLLKARYFFMHHRLLSALSLKLEDQILNQYQQLFKLLSDKVIKLQNQFASSIYIQYSRCLLQFYKYNESSQALEKARLLLKIKLSLVGKLGRKSKYSTKSIPLLTLDIQRQEVNIVDEQQKIQELEEQKIPTNLTLDQESPLLQAPKLDQPLSSSSQSNTAIDCLILSIINHTLKTEAKDEIQREVISSHLIPLTTISEQQKENKKLKKNWLVFSASLMQRSRNQCKSVKRKQRSVLQLQNLIDQFKDTEPNLKNRIQYFFTVKYPFKWELVKETAEAYMSMGVFVSAYQMLKQLELWEQCVECLFLSGKKTKAEQLAVECLSSNQNQPGILCTLGDIRSSASESQAMKCYQKAWELSQYKYARAMRCLGKVYFMKQQLKEAIDCLQKAVNLNRYYSATWFMLGCAYMKTENWKKGVWAFGQVLSIDSDQSDAWANMATCFMQMTNEKKCRQAMKCIEQAVKVRRGSWRLWENLMLLAIETNNLDKSLLAARQLVKLGDQGRERVKVNVVAGICQMVLDKRNEYKGQDLINENLERERLKVKEFIKEFTNVVARNPTLWKLFADFIKMTEYFTYRADEESKLEAKKAIGKEIISYQLKSIKSLMIIDWEKSKQELSQIIQLIRDICQKVMKELLDIEEELTCKQKKDSFIEVEQEFLDSTLDYIQSMQKQLTPKKVDD